MRKCGPVIPIWPAVYQPSRELAQAAAFILLFLLISARQFVNLAKLSTSVKFLDFISDSVLQAFLVPLDKRRKLKRCVRNSWDHLLHL